MTDVDTAGNPGGATSAALAAQLPDAIAALATEAAWTVLHVSGEGGTTWRLEVPGRPDVMLQVVPGAGGGADRLAATRDRLQWLAAAGPPPGTVTPTVLAWAVDDGGDAYLATSALCGVPATDFDRLGDIDAVIVALAAGLRAFHDLPIAACPFAATTDDLVAGARARVQDGSVERDRLGDPYRRYTPDELLDLTVAGRPVEPTGDDVVVCHGNPTLENLLLTAGSVSGFTGLGALGVGDRYADLAVIARDLATRVSPHALGPFFDAYGIEWPDVRRLDFHVLLAELR